MAKTAIESPTRTHRLMGQTAPRGACQWCKEIRDDLIYGWDGIARCDDKKACNNRRVKWLTENGRRPRSFYEELAQGNQEHIRECRRVGVDISKLLQERAQLVKAEADKIGAVGLPPEEDLSLPED